MIRFRCPSCEKQRKVKDSRAGEWMTCPDCDEEIRVPKRGDDKESAPDTGKGDPVFQIAVLVLLFCILYAIIKYR
jgi:hypothetical protein